MCRNITRSPSNALLLHGILYNKAGQVPQNVVKSAKRRGRSSALRDRTSFRSTAKQRQARQCCNTREHVCVNARGIFFAAATARQAGSRVVRRVGRARSVAFGHTHRKRNVARVREREKRRENELYRRGKRGTRGKEGYRGWG